MTEGEKTDLEMVIYFLEKKGDPTSYTGWDRVAKRFPEIAQAWARARSEMARADRDFREAVAEAETSNG